MKETRLQLTSDEFRRLALRAVDLASGFLESLGERPSFPATSGEESVRIFDEPLPEAGLGAPAMEKVADVFDHARPPGPRFFGYALGSGEPVASIADLLASVLNQNVTAWRSGPSAVTIERTVVRWLAEAVGCAGFTGSLTGGGSSANLMGLAMARDARSAEARGSSDERRPTHERRLAPGEPSRTIYASTEAHMSIPKAAALLGLGHDAVRSVPVDAEFRMNPAELERAIASDAAAGKRPIAVVASAGTIATGSIDPLEEIANIARRRGLWMHVDGAYGALAAIAAPEKFRGLALADSLSLDPHKWLYQPVDCGCLLFRDPAAARAVFSHTGDYARSLTDDPIEGFAFFEESAELSRRFRALKLWLSIRYHGMAAFRESIRADLDLAQHLVRAIEARPELELLAPAALSAVCFRYRGTAAAEAGPPPAVTRDASARIPASSAVDLDRLNQMILARIIRRGRVYISNATIDGRFALRACIMNHRSTPADVETIVTEALAAVDDVAE